MSLPSNVARTSTSSFATHVEGSLREGDFSRQPSALHENSLVGDALDTGMKEVDLEKQFSHDPYLVVFQPNDHENPRNWGTTKKWALTMLSSLFVLSSTFASSSPTGIVVPMMAHFQFSQEVAVLTVSLFVAGYCFGPLLWGPLSEQYGRRPIFIISFVGYTACQVGDALAPNTGALLAFRFLGGTFAACPLTNSGALMADIWDVRTRGKAIALFCLSPFAGPALAPAVGGYITVGGASWRWLYWTLTFFAGACLLFAVFWIPETYGPVLLARKARRLRKETGDERYFAEFERLDVPLATRLKEILAKPFIMFAQEVMLMAITVYLAFVYGCTYLLFEAYPIVFQEGHNLNAGASGLMFLPLLFGGIIGVLVYVVFFEPPYVRQIDQYHPKPVPPEERLKISEWVGPFYVVTFFWFGWTSFPSISFWAPMMSGVFFGAGLCLIFLGLINYVIDAYVSVAASALAVTTVIRSMAGAGFPLFASQMFNKLNPRWASTLLGCIALLLMPIPTLLRRYGPYLRRRSKYAPSE